MSVEQSYVELRELAEKATPGPWAFECDSEGCVVTPDPSDEAVVLSPYRESPNIWTPEDWANVAYIAAVSPDVVLGLLAQRDRLRDAPAQAVLDAAVAYIVGSDPRQPEMVMWSALKDAVDAYRRAAT